MTLFIEQVCSRVRFKVLANIILILIIDLTVSGVAKKVLTTNVRNGIRKKLLVRPMQELKFT